MPVYCPPDTTAIACDLFRPRCGCVRRRYLVVLDRWRGQVKAVLVECGLCRAAWLWGKE